MMYVYVWQIIKNNKIQMYAAYPSTLRQRISYPNPYPTPDRQQYSNSNTRLMQNRIGSDRHNSNGYRQQQAIGRDSSYGDKSGVDGRSIDNKNIGNQIRKVSMRERNQSKSNKDALTWRLANSEKPGHKSKYNCYSCLDEPYERIKKSGCSLSNISCPMNQCIASQGKYSWFNSS